MHRFVVTEHVPTEVAGLPVVQTTVVAVGETLAELMNAIETAEIRRCRERHAQAEAALADSKPRRFATIGLSTPEDDVVCHIARAVDPSETPTTVLENVPRILATEGGE